MKRGKIITIEGSDGSGKLTQAKLAFERAKKEGYKVRMFSFPRYRSFLGKEVRNYLMGKYGKISHLHPKMPSMFYALDRFGVSEEIKNWLKKGGNYIFDRYRESNYGHQASKFKGKKRLEMIKWLDKLELEYLKIPESSVVIYLDLPVEFTLKAMEFRKRKLDLHEKDINHLLNAQETYRMLCKKRENWFKINCLRNGKRLSEDEISERAWDIIRPVLEK